MSLKQAATDLLRLIDAGRYNAAGNEITFAAQQRFAVEQTRLYPPDQLASLRNSASPTGTARISVIDGTTQEVARSMAIEAPSNGGTVGLLNFASARNPGGGFLNGAKAQEEDLCRCSGLYPCLLQCLEYYEANRQQDSLLYTDHMIFSPQVPFFKTRGTGELLAEPFFVSVITAPAPNSGPFLRGNPGQTAPLEQTFLRRWQNVLCVARDQGITRLLLGAWGCGAFGGDPVHGLADGSNSDRPIRRRFEQIVFAIPGTGRQSQANLDAFKATFKNESWHVPDSRP